MPLFLEALDRRVELCTARAEAHQYAADLTDLAVLLGDVQTRSGEGRGALATYQKTTTALESCLKMNPEDASLKGQLAQILDRQARVMTDLRDLSGAPVGVAARDDTGSTSSVEA